MAEKKFQLQEDGQAVLQEDFNLLGETSALSDDRVFAELFRITPESGGTITKGILPYGHRTSGHVALIAPNGASGSVLVQPFRALVGSRTAALTEARENWRDIRSGLSVAEGDTSLTQTVTLAANASGNPRWDAIYAVVDIDNDSATVVRKVKSPTTSVVADTSVSVTKTTDVTIAVATGTPGASPARPSIPADSATTFYIILAYVRVPTGFTAGSTVLKADVNTVASTIVISSTTGATSVEPANFHYNSTISAPATWGSSGARPKMVIPPSMTGGKSLFFALTPNDTVALTNGMVLDDRDWRGRICKFMITCSTATAAGASYVFPWLGDAAVVHNGAPCATLSNQLFAVGSNFVVSGMGQTLRTDYLGSTADKRYAAYADRTQLAGLAASVSDIGVYCDSADGGKLKLYIGGAALTYIFMIWIDFSAPFENAY